MIYFNNRNGSFGLTCRFIPGLISATPIYGRWNSSLWSKGRWYPHLDCFLIFLTSFSSWIFSIFFFLGHLWIVEGISAFFSLKLLDQIEAFVGRLYRKDHVDQHLQFVWFPCVRSNLILLAKLWCSGYWTQVVVIIRQTTICEVNSYIYRKEYLQERHC